MAGTCSVKHLFQYVFGPFSKPKYHEALSALHREYGPLVKENIGGRVIVHVFDPEDIKGRIQSGYFVQDNRVLDGFLKFHKM